MEVEQRFTCKKGYMFKKLVHNDFHRKDNDINIFNIYIAGNCDINMK